MGALLHGGNTGTSALDLPFKWVPEGEFRETIELVLSLSYRCRVPNRRGIVWTIAQGDLKRNEKIRNGWAFYSIAQRLDCYR